MKIKSTRGLSEETIREKFPDIIKEIENFLEEDCGVSLKEKIWLYQNGLKNVPKCGNDECLNNVGFIKFSAGYRKYCSKKCAALQSHKSEEVRKSRIHGIESSNKNPELRRLMTERANRTKGEFSDSKKLEIILKRKKTVIEKWGVENISSNDEIRKIISNRLKESLPKSKIQKTKSRIESQNIFEIINIGDNFNLKCKKCQGEFEISRSLFNQRGRFKINQCLLCNPINNTSNFEMEVFGFVSENYSGQVINKFKGFKKYEIDVFLPLLNIGFECNGVWWHSDEYKENRYHIDKSNFFSKEGIRIVHIWEDDWRFKREIIESKIKNIIGSNMEKIWARNCEIKEIDPKISKEFLDKNHLQSNINSKYRIGLFYEGDMVGVMTFGNLRKNLGRESKEGHYELYRFCTKNNIVVVGGASKLLKYFIKNYNPRRIISYASKDWSVGNLYEKIGFDLIKETDPNYFYFHKDEGIRRNRFGFRKDRLVKEGFDQKRTEIEIMHSRGYRRVYDTGSLLYEILTRE